MITILEPGVLSDHTALIQNAIDASRMHTETPGNAAHIIFTPARYTISQKLTLAYTSDTSARISISGYGKRSTVIYSTSRNEPIIDLSTESGNLRDIKISDLCGSRGGYFIKTYKTAYCSFDNLTFDKQWVAGISMRQSLDTIVNPWFVHGFKMAEIVGGVYDQTGGYIGEDMGGIDCHGGGVYINGASGHSLSAKGSNRVEGEKAFFDFYSGAWCSINNCNLTFIGGDGLIRADYPREIILENNRFLLNNVPNIILGRIFNNGTKPQPKIKMEGGIIINMTDTPIKFYKPIISGQDRVTKRTTVDTVIEMKDINKFSWGDEFQIAGNDFAKTSIELNSD